MIILSIPLERDFDNLVVLWRRFGILFVRGVLFHFWLRGGIGEMAADKGCSGCSRGGSIMGIGLVAVVVTGFVVPVVDIA